MNLQDQLVESITSAVLAYIRPQLIDQHRPMTESEVMEMLDIQSKTSMRRMRQEGLVAYQPTGRSYVYFMDDLVAFIKRNGRAV